MELATRTAISVAIPDLLLAALVFAALGPAYLENITANQSTISPPPVIAVAPHATPYRLAGQYLRNGIPVDAPRVAATTGPLSIMQFEVSQADYARYVGDGACRVAADSASNAGAWPVTGVSFIDATAYAAWLSRQTGQFWRLPSDMEWAYAAGSRFADDGFGLAPSTDPSERWRAAYAFENRGDATAVTAVQQQGHFGGNEFGVVDLSGNVWEWTSSCYDRVVTNGDGTIASTTRNCGVRVLEGQHRTYATNFIRDAKGGGCAIGKPPDHLGFRLVRDASPVPLLDRLKIWWLYR